MNEKMNKVLVYFGREDLTDGLYENDIDDNVQVFLTIRQMIKLYNLQSKIDKAIEYLYEHSQYNDEDGIHYIKEDEYCVDYLLDILKEDK